MQAYFGRALSSPKAHSCERAQVSVSSGIAGDSAPAIGQYRENRAEIVAAINGLGPVVPTSREALPATKGCGASMHCLALGSRHCFRTFTIMPVMMLRRLFLLTALLHVHGDAYDHTPDDKPA